MSARGERPRILVVGHGPPTTGGIPSFVSRLVDDPWLAARCSIDYLNTAPRGEKRPGAFDVSNLWETAAHSWAILRRARHADIVHLNLAAAPTLPLVRAIALTVACRLAGARAILHAHTGMIEGCVRARVFRTLLRLELRLTSLMIVVSEAAEAAVRSFGRVAHLPNGVDPSAFATGPKQEEPPLMVFVGTVAERKGLLDLRDALEILAGRPNAALEVTIVGDGVQEGPGSFEAIRGAYARAGLRHVRFAGSLSHARTSELLARADIFCLPSHSEGFPLAILEAMAARAAVIATAVGDVPVLLDGGKAGVLVRTGDASSLADAIAHLVGSPSERLRLADAARDRVEREYTQRRMVERLLELYLRVLPAPRAGSEPPAPARPTEPCGPAGSDGARGG